MAMERNKVYDLYKKLQRKRKNEFLISGWREIIQKCQTAKEGKSEDVEVRKDEENKVSSKCKWTNKNKYADATEGSMNNRLSSQRDLGLHFEGDISSQSDRGNSEQDTNMSNTHKRKKKKKKPKLDNERGMEKEDDNKEGNMFKINDNFQSVGKKRKYLESVKDICDIKQKKKKKKLKTSLNDDDNSAAATFVKDVCSVDGSLLTELPDSGRNGVGSEAEENWEVNTAVLSSKTSDSSVVSMDYSCGGRYVLSPDRFECNRESSLSDSLLKSPSVSSNCSGSFVHTISRKNSKLHSTPKSQESDSSLSGVIISNEKNRGKKIKKHKKGNSTTDSSVVSRDYSSGGRYVLSPDRVEHNRKDSLSPMASCDVFKSPSSNSSGSVIIPTLSRKNSESQSSLKKTGVIISNAKNRNKKIKKHRKGNSTTDSSVVSRDYSSGGRYVLSPKRVEHNRKDSLSPMASCDVFKSPSSNSSGSVIIPTLSRKNSESQSSLKKTGVIISNEKNKNKKRKKRKKGNRTMTNESSSSSTEWSSISLSDISGYFKIPKGNKVCNELERSNGDKDPLLQISVASCNKGVNSDMQKNSQSQDLDGLYSTTLSESSCESLVCNVDETSASSPTHLTNNSMGSESDCIVENSDSRTSSGNIDGSGTGSDESIMSPQIPNKLSRPQKKQLFPATSDIHGSHSSGVSIPPSPKSNELSSKPSKCAKRINEAATVKLGNEKLRENNNDAKMRSVERVSVSQCHTTKEFPVKLSTQYISTLLEDSEAQDLEGLCSTSDSCKSMYGSSSDAHLSSGMEETSNSGLSSDGSFLIASDGSDKSTVSHQNHNNLYKSMKMPSHNVHDKLQKFRRKSSQCLDKKNHIPRDGMVDEKFPEEFGDPEKSFEEKPVTLSQCCAAENTQNMTVNIATQEGSGTKQKDSESQDLIGFYSRTRLESSCESNTPVSNTNSCAQVEPDITAGPEIPDARSEKDTLSRQKHRRLSLSLTKMKQRSSDSFTSSEDSSLASPSKVDKFGKEASKCSDSYTRKDYLCCANVLTDIIDADMRSEAAVCSPQCHTHDKTNPSHSPDKNTTMLISQCKNFVRPSCESRLGDLNETQSSSVTRDTNSSISISNNDILKPEDKPDTLLRNSPVTQERRMTRSWKSLVFAPPNDKSDGCMKTTGKLSNPTEETLDRLNSNRTQNLVSEERQENHNTVKQSQDQHIEDGEETTDTSSHLVPPEPEESTKTVKDISPKKRGLNHNEDSSRLIGTSEDNGESRIITSDNVMQVCDNSTSYPSSSACTNEAVSSLEHENPRRCSARLRKKALGRNEKLFVHNVDGGNTSCTSFHSGSVSNQDSDENKHCLMSDPRQSLRNKVCFKHSDDTSTLTCTSEEKCGNETSTNNNIVGVIQECDNANNCASSSASVNKASPSLEPESPRKHSARLYQKSLGSSNENLVVQNGHGNTTPFTSLHRGNVSNQDPDGNKPCAMSDVRRSLRNRKCINYSEGRSTLAGISEEQSANKSSNNYDIHGEMQTCDNTHKCGGSSACEKISVQLENRRRCSARLCKSLGSNENLLLHNVDSRSVSNHNTDENKLSSLSTARRKLVERVQMILGNTAGATNSEETTKVIDPSCQNECISSDENPVHFDEDLICEIRELLDVNACKLQTVDHLSIDITWNCPLTHTISTCLTRPLKLNHKMKLKRNHVKCSTEAFSGKEDEVIVMNWGKFCKEYNISNPAPFVNLHRSCLDADQRTKFVQYIGRTLDNRILFLIYTRFQYLMHKHSDMLFSKEEDELLKYFVTKHKVNFKTLSKIFPVDTNLLHLHYQELKEKAGTIQPTPSILSPHLIDKFSSTCLSPVIIEGNLEWTLDMKSKLVSAILSAMDSTDIEELREPNITVNWKKVEILSGIPANRAWDHWHYHLYTQVFLNRPLTDIMIIVDVVKKLYKMNITKAKAINWETITKDFHGASRRYIAGEFRKFMKKLKMDRSWRTKIVYLYENWIPKADKMPKKYIQRLRWDAGSKQLVPITETKSALNNE